MKIPEGLQAAYRNTNYCVSAPGQIVVLRVGLVSEGARNLMAACSAEGGVFITAWNPFGKVLSQTENIKANAALKKELEDVATIVLAGYGSSPDVSWREDSFFAFPIGKSTATEFCCRYAQNAVIFVGSDGVPELVFHPNVGAP